MKKAIAIITLACLALLPGACLNTASPMISDELLAASHMMLHPNPRAGDYAVQKCVVKGVMNGKSSNITMTIRQEITAIQPGRITLRMMSVTDAAPAAPLHYEYILDEAGNTLEAFYLDMQTGRKIRLRVIMNGSGGYTVQKCEDQAVIEGKEYTVYTYKLDGESAVPGMKDINMDAAMLIFSLPDIPFLIVEAFNVNLPDFRVTSRTFTGNWLEPWREMERDIITAHITLKEFGRGH